MGRSSTIQFNGHHIELADASDDAAGTTEDRDELERALARLSPDQRVVVALRFYRDWTVDDIAERLAIPPGTVKSRLHHALARLADYLTPKDAPR